MERRDFIKKTSLLAATALLSSKTENDDFEPLKKNENVLILGAGISGLTAAYRLVQKGVNVQILEARNRLGGRVFTYSFPEAPEIYTELGGEWVGSSHKNLQNLCQELQLELVPHRFKIDWLLNGKFIEKNKISDSQWNVKFTELLENFKKSSSKQIRALEKISWWQFLKKNGTPEEILLMRELNDSTDFGESIRFISASSALSEYAYSSPYNEMDFQVRGGNSQIIEKLAEKIGKEKILTGKKVQKINQQGKKVQVICNDNSIYQADKAICTLPTYALSQVSWSPDLPIIQKNAIEQLQYARIVKTQVLFSERFWQQDDFALNTDEFAHFIFHTTQKQNSPKGVLTSYSVGDKAYLIGKMSKNKQKDLIIEALKPVFGDVSNLVEQVVSYDWGSDLYTQGAYAYYCVGQGEEIKNILAQPFRNVLFAGEHIAEWQGFMEGAVQTAQKAVEKLTA